VVVKLRQTFLVGLASCLAMHPTSVSAKSINLAFDCVSPEDPIARTSTDEMVGWMSSYSAAWNPDYAFSIGGTGAIGRLFAPNGRLIHPAELASGVSRSPSFTGKKKKRVELGFSDSQAGDGNSYTSQLSKLLETKVTGCDSDAYFVKAGGMMCGSNPVFIVKDVKDPGRSMPAGFSIGTGGFMMLFCSNGRATAVDPRKVLTTSAVYGLFAVERDELITRADDDPLAAFRLYQYYWLSAREPKSALVWLEKAAALEMDVAKFNLAYELYEAGGAENQSKAEALSAELVTKGFAGPDLRTAYVGK
jgi:hypothetical protein